LYYHKGRSPHDLGLDENNYFVPSFSIRQHLHRDEEKRWEDHRRMLSRSLGRGFATTPVPDITLKTVEQHRFIKNMRQADIHPDPEEIRDLAYSIRDGLTDLLVNVRSPLPVPLGKFGRFGYRNNALAYEIEGWEGDRKHYGANDAEGYKDAHAVLLEMRQLSVGAIALAYQNSDLSVEGIAPNPHLTVARSNAEIQDHDLRSLRGKLAGLALEDVELGDPVIQMKLYPDQAAETLYVKHAWQSLVMPDVEESTVYWNDMTAPSIEDHYEDLANQTRLYV
jgi:hypothetical protein